MSHVLVSCGLVFGFLFREGITSVISLLYRCAAVSVLASNNAVGGLGKIHI